MYDSYVQFGEELKKEIEKKIVNLVISGLQNKLLVEKDLPEIGDFVLERIDLINTEVELDAFLGELAKKWPCFSYFELSKKEDISKKVDNEIADGVELLIEHGKLDRALSLLKNRGRQTE